MCHFVSSSLANLLVSSSVWGWQFTKKVPFQIYLGSCLIQNSFFQLCFSNENVSQSVRERLMAVQSVVCTEPNWERNGDQKSPFTAIG